MLCELGTYAKAWYGSTDHAAVFPAASRQCSASGEGLCQPRRVDCALSAEGALPEALNVAALACKVRKGQVLLLRPLIYEGILTHAPQYL